MYFGENGNSRHEGVSSNRTIDEKLARRHKKVTLILSLSSLLSLIIIAALAWFFLIRKSGSQDPFTPQVSSSVQFPLYYPTYVPTGFRVDPKSLTEPQAGVVVFDMVGPKNAKLYVSEEARPSEFDLGGFYKSLVGLHEIGVSDGAIAVGWLHSSPNEVGSRANNKTWILSNTTANIPQTELIHMLESLAATS